MDNYIFKGKNTTQNNYSSQKQAPSRDSNAYDMALSEQYQSDEDFLRNWDLIFNNTEATCPEVLNKPAIARIPKFEHNIKKPKTGAQRKTGIKVLATLLIFAVLYLVLVFSNIAFIAKWRTLYIETAMSTMTHQWLATAFIPAGVIDQVVLDRDNLEDLQSGLDKQLGYLSFFIKGSLSPLEKRAEEVF